MDPTRARPIGSTVGPDGSAARRAQAIDGERQFRSLRQNEKCPIGALLLIRGAAIRCRIDIALLESGTVPQALQDIVDNTPSPFSSHASVL